MMTRSCAWAGFDALPLAAGDADVVGEGEGHGEHQPDTDSCGPCHP